MQKRKNMYWNKKDNELRKLLIKRLLMKMSEIYSKKCRNIIESKTTNDLKRCSCGAVAVDGGKEYLKRIGNDEDYEELSIIKNTSQS